jgi:phage tail tape-measure protein
MMDPSLYNPVMMPNKFSYIEEAGAKAKREKQAKATPWATAIGSVLGAVAGSIIPGAGTTAGAMAGASLGSSIGGSLGGAVGSLFGGGAQADAEAQAEEEYGQMYASKMADRNKSIADAMDQARQDAYLSEIQNMRKNVMPNRTEYLKFV